MNTIYVIVIGDDKNFKILEAFHNKQLAQDKVIKIRNERSTARDKFCKEDSIWNMLFEKHFENEPIKKWALRKSWARDILKTIKKDIIDNLESEYSTTLWRKIIKYVEENPLPIYKYNIPSDCYIEIKEVNI